MTVRVELFGRAADQAGIREVAIDLPAGASMEDVGARLVALYPALAWLRSIARPARNMEYVGWDEPAADGDEISFIPPVSGGAPAAER